MFHEFFSVGLCSLLDGVGQLAEARENALDITAVLHGNDAALVLLIAPAQHSLVGIVKDATARGPVAPSTRRIMKNFSLWTCIFNFMNCMSNMQLERPYCMSGRQNACPCVICMSNMHFGFLPGKDMHFGKQYTCPQGTMFSDMHIRK